MIYIPLRRSVGAYVTSKRRVGLGVGKTLKVGSGAATASLGGTVALAGPRRPSLAAGLSIKFR